MMQPHLYRYALLRAVPDGRGRPVLHVRARCITDCAKICRLSSDLLLRSSQFADNLCALWATVCDACPDSCDLLDPKDEYMKECSTACMRCAESCRAMGKSNMR